MFPGDVIYLCTALFGRLKRVYGSDATTLLILLAAEWAPEKAAVILLQFLHLTTKWANGPNKRKNAENQLPDIRIPAFV